MATNHSKKRLRILTYCPEVSVDVFFLIRDCVEEATGLETDLIVENRFTGPPLNRTDPFTENLADIVAIHSTDYLRLKAQGQTQMELCPAAPVYKHPMAQDRPVYFSEIIINSSNEKKYKSIRDLKGCSWTYNNEDSVSGNLVVLKYLKSALRTNAVYFGNIVPSGNQLNSIQMVKDFRVDAAAVDSSVLARYIREHEDSREKFISLVSLGPLPVHPLLFNSNLSVELKQKITEALLSMYKSRSWASKLNDVGINKFVSIDSTLYNLEEAITSGLQGMNINPTYY
uniref:Solute-binding protein family 3/N-terminal domain-containing protein n=1 Tax=Arion vulgaris TaxID=1028688 RepID=A0A0B7A2M0_9EUPU